MKKLSLAAIPCVFVCILVFSVIFGLNHKVAFATNETVSVEQLCRQYTDSISPNGVNFYDYVNDVNDSFNKTFLSDISSNIRYTLNKGTYFDNNTEYSGAGGIVKGIISGDDNIVSLIPKVLFTYENSTLFVGKYYGFFVNTTYENNEFNCTVFLLEVQNRIADYLVDVNICVCATIDFAYIRKGYTERRRLYKTTNPLTLTAVLASFDFKDEIENAVVPLPRIEEVNGAIKIEQRLKFSESNKYMLGNISFAAQVRNQNTYNMEDAQYDVYKDNGYFFIGNNFYYSASKYKSNKFEQGITQLVSNGFEAGLDYLISEIDWPSDFAGMSKLLQVTDKLIEVCNALSTLSSKIEYKETNGRNGYGYDAQYLPNTRQSQLNKYNKLIKASHIVLKSSGNDTLYFRKGDFANAQFSLSHTDGGNPEFAQFEMTVAANLYKGSNRELITAVVSPSVYHDINTPNITEVPSISYDNDYYLLPYGSQVFKYAAYDGGSYFIDGLPDNIDVYLNNVKQKRQNGKIYFNLEADQEYKIVLINKASYKQSGTFLIDVSTLNAAGENITIGANKSVLRKFVPTKSGVYTFNSGDFVIADLITVNQNGAYERNRTFSPSFTASSEISAFCESGKEYYVSLQNKTSSELTSSIKATELLKSWNLGNNAGLALQPNVTYTKFVTPNDGSVADYVFTFNNATSIQYIVLDGDGNYCEKIYKSSGYLHVKNMKPGKTYYIGVWSTKDKLVTPNVAKYSKSVFGWKVYDNNALCSADSTGVYNLIRGKTYRVELWVNNAKRYDDIVLGGDSIGNLTSTSVLFDINEASLTLAADRDLESTFYLCAVDIADAIATVRTKFNPDEIKISGVDLENKIAVSMTKSQFVTNILYQVTGKSSANANISYSGNLTNNVYSNGLKDLYSRKALNNVTFKITSVKVKNKYNKGVFDVAIGHISTAIDCSSSNVTNALNLFNIRYQKNSDYKLINNIDVSTLGGNWIPIPEWHSKFNGDYKIITGMKIDIPENIVGSRKFGMFEQINEAGTVLNTELEITITSAPKHGEDYVYVGGIAGQNYGTIGLCMVRGTLECHRNRSCLGGVVGANYRLTSWSTFKGVIYGNGDMGGIAGYSSDRIEWCNVTNSEIKHYVEGEAHSVGGVVGHCYGGNIYTSKFNSSSIYAANTKDVKNIKTRMGTIVGHLQNATMSESCKANQSCTWASNHIKDKSYCFKNADSRVGRLDNSTIS